MFEQERSKVGRRKYLVELVLTDQCLYAEQSLLVSWEGFPHLPPLQKVNNQAELVSSIDKYFLWSGKASGVWESQSK